MGRRERTSEEQRNLKALLLKGVSLLAQQRNLGLSFNHLAALPGLLGGLDPAIVAKEECQHRASDADDEHEQKGIVQAIVTACWVAQLWRA